VVQGETERRHRFEALFDAYTRDVAAYCSWRTTSPSDAEDAVAEVFLVAWRRLDDIPTGDAARAWLYATARRVIANQRRSRRRLDALRRRMTREAAVWPQAPATVPEAAGVKGAMAQLSQLDREVLLLAEWEGLTAAEIAQVLGCLVVTARGRLHRARRRFGEVFESMAGADGRGELDAASPVPPEGSSAWSRPSEVTLASDATNRTRKAGT
jgi:RNA polymerase sigma factor (sigma-70 family)